MENQDESSKARIKQLEDSIAKNQNNMEKIASDLQKNRIISRNLRYIAAAAFVYMAGVISANNHYTSELNTDLKNLKSREETSVIVEKAIVKSMDYVPQVDKSNYIENVLNPQTKLRLTLQDSINTKTIALDSLTGEKWKSWGYLFD